MLHKDNDNDPCSSVINLTLSPLKSILGPGVVSPHWHIVVAESHQFSPAICSNVFNSKPID